MSRLIGPPLTDSPLSSQVITSGLDQLDAFWSTKIVRAGPGGAEGTQRSVLQYFFQSLKQYIQRTCQTMGGLIELMRDAEEGV